jgi:hypothetical protein
MKRLLMFAGVMVLGVVAVLGESTVGPGRSARDTLARFLKGDAEGKQLAAAGSADLAGIFEFVNRYHPNSARVIKDYRIRGRIIGNSGKGKAEFQVEYLEWGPLDSSMCFTRWEGRVPHAPIKHREFFSLALTDTHREVDPDGKEWKKVKGPWEWRITMNPSEPRITVDTAIRYATEMSDKSSDPVIKQNASKTIVALKRLLLPIQDSMASRKTPVMILEEYCKMDAEGKQLSPDGWKEMARFFVRPAVPHLAKLIVAKNFGVGNASLTQEEKANVSAFYTYLGEINRRTGRFGLALLGQEPVSNIPGQADYTLYLTDTHWELEPDGTTIKEVTGPLEWKLEGPPYDPRITVDTAIRYMTEMRQKSTDPTFRRNAAKTLTALKAFLEPSQ